MKNDWKKVFAPSHIISTTDFVNNKKVTGYETKI